MDDVLALDCVPICWLAATVVAGRRIEATIRKYHSTAYCWVVLCDDGFINSTRGSSVEESFEDARAAVGAFSRWYLEEC